MANVDTLINIPGFVIGSLTVSPQGGDVVFARNLGSGNYTVSSYDTSQTSQNGNYINVFPTNNPLTNVVRGICFHPAGTYVYVSTGGTIRQIPYPFTIPRNDVTLSQMLNQTYYPSTIAVDANGTIYAYDNLTGDNQIIKQDSSGNVSVVVKDDTLLAYIDSMVISNDGNTLYLRRSDIIRKVTLNTSPPAVSTLLSSNLLSTGGLGGLGINPTSTYLFASNGNIIYAINTANGQFLPIAGNGNAGFVDGPALTTAEFESAIALTVSAQDIMYVTDGISLDHVRRVTNFDPFAALAPAGPAPSCFMEGTKILTDKGYLPIETLRAGDKIKTLKAGFVPIHAIGKRVIKNPRVEERVPEQLYVCSSKNYPEVFEDLIITGYHSFLTENFDNEKHIEETRKVLGKIYITEDLYRIPICIDKRAEIYGKKGDVMIYHFALEHNDYYMNYGVYANGLLVESTSKHFLLEDSGMELF